MGELEIQFVDADVALKSRIAEEWGEIEARHLHLEDGFRFLPWEGMILLA